MHGATFRRLLPHLAPHVTCHLVDLPGCGASRWTAATPLGLDTHVHAVRAVLDALDLDDVALVGHDSGGMIARHAMAGDDRLRGLGLVDTEQPQGLAWRFRAFLAPRHLPGFGALFRWAILQRGLRRSPALLGDCFVDQSLLDGEFEELFLRPIYDDPRLLDATIRILRGFDAGMVHALGEVHRRIHAPVQLVWGAKDPFFPVLWAEEMVDTFADARLHVVDDGKLFVHEECPEEVAEALRPVLVGHRQDRAMTG